MSDDRQTQELRDAGWTLLSSAVPRDVLAALLDGLQRAYAEQRAIQIANGVGDRTDGTVHHLPCADAVFLAFLAEHPGRALLEAFFGGPYILNTFGGVLNLPDNLSYVGRIHRDQRIYSGDVRLMAQLLVMLDDFTEDNGATFFLSGSHRMPEPPSDEAFFRSAARALGSAGSVVVFDSNLWHAAGANRTAAPRRALTLAFTRPFVKQQLDYPRALGYERRDALSPALRQLLGYNARVPATLDEWYQPPDRRLYHRDQG